MIVCTRTVDVPEAQRERFLNWIASNRDVRERHGILFELVLRPATEPATAAYAVITAWPSDTVFDAWIATPVRARLTASDVHASVSYTPITRHELIGGYLNLAALAKETDA